MNKTDSISIGNCGEYFVAAELERNDFTAAVPMSNTKSFDVLAIHKKSGKQIAIQVKTNHTDKKTWTLSAKDELQTKENVYYVLVCLNGREAPDYYILPSKLVAQSIQASHAKWLGGKTKDGQKRNDTTIRKFSFEIAKYNPFGLSADTYNGKWQLLTEGEK